MHPQVSAPPSECGICGASVAWDGESRGTWAKEALCLGVQLFEVRCPRWGVEWRGTRWHCEEMRSQGGRGKWGICNDRGACEMGKLGLEGLKRDGRVSFGFHITSFDFRIAAFDFRTVCKMALGVRNEFVGLIYFRTVCWIGSQGVRNFHTLCKMSHGVDPQFCPFSTCL